ncbi:MAG: glycerophosphodiester phosphodiesterase [Flavobacteriaceae bacterium]
MSKIKSAGLQIFAWTVNKPEDIASLIDLGIDGIITDFPERVPKRQEN